MTLKELTGKLGIETYPEKFDEIYENSKNLDLSFCDLGKIKEFNEKYDNVFKEYTDAVLDGAKALSENKELLTYCAVVCEYLKDCDISEAKAIPFPTVELGIATDMFRLFPLLSTVPAWTRRFEEHGFSHDEIKGIYRVLYICLNLSKIATEKYGFTQTYYGWTLLYTYCEMFDYGSFNFQFRRLASPVILLKNKKSGKHAVLMTEGEFHKSGKILGTIGFEETEGSFSAEFAETDDAYVGHTACDSYVSPELSTFKKSEWECVVKSGDEIIGIHIPRNIDLSAEAIWASYEGGMKMAKERFPEYSPKCLFCSSWIIDAQLEELLGDKSRIVGFGKTFLRFPNKSTVGRDGFSFVFLGHNGPESELPEDTSLRRKLKNLYLNGGYTYASSGFVVEY
jgi:hypothetical protein